MLFQYSDLVMAKYIVKLLALVELMLYLNVLPLFLKLPGFIPKQMFSYRDGTHVLLAKSDSVSCPFHLLNRYVGAANLDLSSSLPFFRSLHIHKVTSSCSWRSTGMSSRTKEIVLQAFAELGYPKHLFGLHSLRAAGAGVSDRLLKRHGRWRTDRAKDGYITHTSLYGVSGQQTFPLYIIISDFVV